MKCWRNESLGKAARSSSSTRCPRRASSMASGDPAQRAPTTITSYTTHLPGAAIGPPAVRTPGRPQHPPPGGTIPGQIRTPTPRLALKVGPGAPPACCGRSPQPQPAGHPAARRRTAARTASRASPCWRRSGSTPPSGWRPAARRTPYAGATPPGAWPRPRGGPHLEFRTAPGVARPAGGRARQPAPRPGLVPGGPGGGGDGAAPGRRPGLLLVLPRLPRPGTAPAGRGAGPAGGGRLAGPAGAGPLRRRQAGLDAGGRRARPGPARGERRPLRRRRRRPGPGESALQPGHVPGHAGAAGGGPGGVRAGHRGLPASPATPGRWPSCWACPARRCGSTAGRRPPATGSPTPAAASTGSPIPGGRPACASSRAAWRRPGARTPPRRPLRRRHGRLPARPGPPGHHLEHPAPRVPAPAPGRSGGGQAAPGGEPEHGPRPGTQQLHPARPGRLRGRRRPRGTGRDGGPALRPGRGLLDAPAGAGGPTGDAARATCGRLLAALRARTAPEALAAWWAAGAALTTSGAVALALAPAQPA